MTCIRRLLTVLLLVATLVGCGSTRFVSTWKEPGVGPAELDGRTVAAFLISKDEDTRRTAEDVLARELTARGAQGVAGYTVLSVEASKDEQRAARILKEAGVDAVVSMRVVGEEEQVTTSPGTWHAIPYYRTWGGYWQRSWYTVYQPGYEQTNTVVSVETLAYSLESGKLIWASLSETTNPGNIESFITELSKAVDEAMRDAGLLR